MMTMSFEDIIYIGTKPIMVYCTAVLTSFKNEGNRVTLKARGRSISTAVDVAEVTKNRFMDNLIVENIMIGTEALEGQDGQVRNVSTIAIVLRK